VPDRRVRRRACSGDRPHTALILWLVDLTIRYVWYTMFANRVTASAMRLPASVVRLSFERPPMLHYSAGQYVFVLVPAIGWTQWHPFSVSSAPHQKEVRRFSKFWKLGKR